MSARDAYDRARRSDAAQYAPDSVLGAKQALQVAERKHEDDAGSDAEKSYAYVAQRRAELAMTQGTIAKQRSEREQADQQYVQVQDQLRQKTQNQLTATQGQLQNEQQARMQAEQEAQRAMESLQQVAQVREEQRGTVITLSGEVLFLTGKSDLLPAAKTRLTEVAKALQETDRPITIEGHTDARGNEQMNATLSQARADSVRTFLISQGVPAERLSAVGRGEAQPVASNDTTEGRANNRRVEIVVGGQNPNGATPPMTPASNPSPTPSPSTSPSTSPSSNPSTSPSSNPSTSSGTKPSTSPSASPSAAPRHAPATKPSAAPSSEHRQAPPKTNP